MRCSALGGQPYQRAWEPVRNRTIPSRRKLINLASIAGMIRGGCALSGVYCGGAPPGGGRYPAPPARAPPARAVGAPPRRARAAGGSRYSGALREVHGPVTVALHLQRLRGPAGLAAGVPKSLPPIPPARLPPPPP